MEKVERKGPKIYRWAYTDDNKAIAGEFVRLKDYAKLETENKRLLKELDELIAWHEGDDCPRARLEAVARAARKLLCPSLEENGVFCVVCGTNILHTDALLNALAAAGYGEDE